MDRVSCLGPEGSYSWLAAGAMCCGAELVCRRTFAQAAGDVLCGSSSAAVLPIENTINGGVLQNLDLLAAHDGLFAVREYTLRIDHRLITLAGADAAKVNRIFSHRQAIEQCAAFLNAHYPEAELVAENSTAASIARIGLPTDAAIAGAQCACAGYDVSPECISDEKNNFTHFLLVVKGGPRAATRSAKVFLTFTCRHVPGALLNMLSIIYDHSLNMTKIESRPIKDRPGEYRFFVEVEGDYSSAEMKNALRAVEREAHSFRVLGAY